MKLDRAHLRCVTAAERSERKAPSMRTNTVSSSVSSLPRPGAVHGGPAAVLRLEGLGLLAAACLAYAHLGGSWGWFALCFLAPDLSFLGYLVDTKVGAAAYDAAHSTLGGLALAGLGAALGAHGLLLAACVWLAHVGFDRALGYGLKYATGFGDTHLGAKGAAAAAMVVDATPARA